MRSLKQVIIFFAILFVVFELIQIRKEISKSKAEIDNLKKPTTRYFSEWPENGTFWEVQIEQGWINDSPPIQNKRAIIHLKRISVQ